MKLSDAIDEGSLLKPQAFECLADSGGTCALEAACEALGISVSEWSFLDEKYPWTSRNIECPQCGAIDRIFDTIWHLNDDHHMPRPKIAAWLRTIEPIEDAQSALQHAEAAVEQAVTPR